jgi:hypothetical protein
MSIIARAVEAVQAQEAAAKAHAGTSEPVASASATARAPLFAGPAAARPATEVAPETPVTSTAHDTITRLYEALADLDGAAMQACYAPDAQFADEVFTLRGARQIGGMWRMLCDATQDKGSEVWLVRTGPITRDGTVHRVRWQATYLFSATGRIVHNLIDATIEVGPDGLIRSHRDRFGFWRWSRQALGAPGLLAGWTPWLRTKVRRLAAARLAEYLSDPVHWTH